MADYQELKQRTWEANLELPRQGLVLYTFGNVSTIDREQGVIAIKPSGVPYDRLQPGDIVIVDMDNKVVEGKLRPSSDTKTHLVLYKQFSTIGGVVHTHASYSTAWAQAMRAVTILGTTHADHLTMDIPCTEPMNEAQIKGDYEVETGNQIIRLFREQNLDYRAVEMVLVACHGPFTWGSSPEKAVYNSVILEELAKMALLTYQVNPLVPRLSAALIDKHFQRKHGKHAYYGQQPDAD